MPFSDLTAETDLSTIGWQAEFALAEFPARMWFRVESMDNTGCFFPQPSKIYTRKRVTLFATLARTSDSSVDNWGTVYYCCSIRTRGSFSSSSGRTAAPRPCSSQPTPPD